MSDSDTPQHAKPQEWVIGPSATASTWSVLQAPMPVSMDARFVLVPAADLAAAEAEIEALKVERVALIEEAQFQMRGQNKWAASNRVLIAERDEALAILEAILADTNPPRESKRHPCVLNYERAGDIIAFLAKAKHRPAGEGGMR